MLLMHTFIKNNGCALSKTLSTYIYIQITNYLTLDVFDLKEEKKKIK
jgi:hypothetical protein